MPLKHLELTIETEPRKKIDNIILGGIRKLNSNVDLKKAAKIVDDALEYMSDRYSDKIPVTDLITDWWVNYSKE